ncbi:hypothetical protein [Micromonospora chalcea]|uniref:hypothetical protein n=1 Tax=Micromonospora chalcea TaxID=1874 RepID=UPI003D72D80E
MEYVWELQRKDLGLWVHHQGVDPRGSITSDLPASEVARDLARRLLVRGEWRVAVWDAPWPGRGLAAVAVRRSCVTCGGATQLAHEINGHLVVIDPEPVDGGDLVLIGRPEDPTVVWGVSPGGETLPWGPTVPAGAPRYRKHECA